MTDIIIEQDPTKLSTNVLQPPVAVVAPPKKTFSRLYGKHDVLDGEYNLSQKLLAELIGTTLFVYGVCSCGVYGSNTACSIVGSSFMGGVIIYIFGRISGAHFNPAVSLGLFLRHKLNCRELILYIVMQIIGGFIGCILLALCRRGRFEELAGNQISHYIYNSEDKKNAWSYISALLFEIFGTFVLIMFILASCERDNYLGPALGLAFSITLIALSGIGGNISSCSLNPARSIAPAFIMVFIGETTPLKQLWLYILGPILGGISAGYIPKLFE